MKAKRGKERGLREVLLALIQPTHAEEGCLQYDLHQSTEDPTLFLFYENWAGEKPLTAHFQTPHVQTALARAAELLEAPPEFYRLKRINP